MTSFTVDEKQKQIVKQIGQQAINANAPDPAFQIAVMTALQESRLRNLSGGSGNSVGVFQQQVQYYGSGARSVDSAARMFFVGRDAEGIKGLMDFHNWRPNDPEQIGYGAAAQEVQRSAYPHAYDQWADMAGRLVIQARNEGLAAAPGSGLDSGDWQSPGGGNNPDNPTATKTVNLRSLAGKPFKFNPPPHPSIRPVRVDYASSSITDLNESLDLANQVLTEQQVMAKSYTYEKFAKLRQGRIVMSDQAMLASAHSNYRFGFRFLYQPSTISGGQHIDTSIVIDPQNTGNYFLQNGLEQISFSVLLNRTPDVIGGATRASYSQAMGDDDFEGIRDRGTGWDLEYLYRVCNGVHNTKTRNRTGDIGMLLPNPCELILGPGLRYYGVVGGLSIQDIMFSLTMVPVLTEVQIAFTRWVNMTPRMTAEFKDRAGLIDSEEAQTQPGAPPPIVVPPGSAGDVAAKLQRVIVNARSQLGVKYVFGAEQWNVALDCSGLVRGALSRAGFTDVPRTSGAQRNWARPGFVSSPQAMSKWFLGDLICWDGHIAIYLGNGQIIEAPHTNAVVRIRNFPRPSDPFDARCLGAYRYTGNNWRP